jgi:ABC transporter DrrB family efflux protein
MVAELGAFIRQNFLVQTSYRVRTVFSLFSLFAIVVPVYFIAHAVQPIMAESISTQGGQYFGFLIVGLATQRLMSTTLTALPQNISAGIRTGTLEALFITPVRLPTLLAGMISYRTLWSFIEALLLLVVGVFLGAQLIPERIPAALGIVLVIAFAYAAFGLLGAAAQLAFRTMGPFATLVGMSSVLLGGVYYPTEVIPSWLQNLSAVIPLTYGLRALRRTLLEGLSVSQVAGDLAILTSFAIGLLVVSGIVFHRAFQYARKSGSLAQY